MFSSVIFPQEKQKRTQTPGKTGNILVCSIYGALLLLKKRTDVSFSEAHVNVVVIAAKFRAFFISKF